MLLCFYIMPIELENIYPPKRDPPTKCNPPTKSCPPPFPQSFLSKTAIYCLTKNFMKLPSFLHLLILFHILFKSNLTSCTTPKLNSRGVNFSESYIRLTYKDKK